MLQPALAILGALLISFIPAQAKQATKSTSAAKQVVASQGFGVSTSGDACEHLSREECCGQMLEIAGFEAHGDQLPRLVKNTVRLTCMGQSNVVTPQMCRSIMMTRGFDSKESSSACKQARARNRCRKDGTCNQCVSDLAKLSYRGAHNACYAITYVPPAQDRVVRIGEKSDKHFNLTRRRKLN